MPSGAGLNRWGEFGGVPILSTSAASGTVDSGAIVGGGQFFSKWAFQLIAGSATSLSGHSVAIYGTIDPNAILYWQNGVNGKTPDLSSLPASSWFALPAPADGSSGDTSTWNNPLTATGQCLYTPMPLVAVRALDTITSGTGDLIVLAMAIP